MPIYTNNYGLPKPVAMALAADDYDKHGDYSTTGLIGPPRAHFLIERHSNEIVIDVMDNSHALRGNALHYVASKANHRRAIIEERFLYHIDGFQISMKPDIVWPEDEKANEFSLYDYKDCSTWVARLTKGKDEWTKQCNLLRLGMHERGFNITKLAIIAFFKDWTQKDAIINTGGNYPKHPIKELPIDIVDLEKVKHWLRQRIKLFESCKHLPDDKLPICTPEERWNSDSCHAVVHVKDGKPGKAVSGGTRFATANEAESFRLNQKDPQNKMVVFREGCNKRCEKYCDAKDFCDFYRNTVDNSPF